MCHAHVAHKWLYHQDAFAGSVLTPHDYITNVQKRLGNRAYTGLGQCRLCGSFLESQLEHGETCSTAEASRGHYACVHAVLGGLRLTDPGITTEPRGLTEAQSRAAELFTTAAVPGRSAALDVCVGSSNAAAGRGDAAQAAFDRKILTLQMRNFRPSSSRHRLSPSWFGQQTIDHAQQSPEPYNMQQTWQHDTHISKRRTASRWPHKQSHQPLGPSTPVRWRRR